MASESESRSQSEFNMAVSYLSRLNALFYLCNDAAISLDSYNWFHTLMALYRELSTEMKKDEIDKLQKDMKKLNVAVNRNMDNIRRKGTIIIESELYQSLHDFEMELRRILKSAGLQIKMTDKILDAMK